MTTRPILMCGESVAGILAGRKTQTRRIVKPDKSWVKFYDGDKAAAFEAFHRDSGKPWNCGGINWQSENELLSPNYQVGQMLWVKETFKDFPDGDVFYAESFMLPDGKIAVPVHADDNYDDWRWKPSIFMPRAASRLTLELTDVRVEKLQAITEADAIAEGMNPIRAKMAGSAITVGPIDDYRELWEKINGKGSWAKNPWVWKLTFKRANL